jgi:hypothetical protein
MFDNQGKSFIFRNVLYRDRSYSCLGRPRQKMGFLFAVWTILIRQVLSLAGDLGGGFKELIRKRRHISPIGINTIL